MRWSHVARSFFVILPALVLLAACSGTETPTPVAFQQIRVGGSSSLQPVLRALTDAYSAENPTVRFDFERGDSHVGLQRVQAGQLDLAASSWLTSTEIPDLQITPLVLDAVVIVVNSSNPITNVTMLQLRDIYRGRALTWRDVGGLDAPISVVSREAGSGTRAFFEKNVMNDAKVSLTSLVVPSEDAMIDFVASHPEAIGYVSLRGLQFRPANDLLKMVSVENILPTSENLPRIGYHLVRPTFLLAPASSSATLQPFLDFITSPAGQAILASNSLEKPTSTNP